MSFCKYSTEYIRSNHIEVDNYFLQELMPAAPDLCVKVYLYGLYLCENANNFTIDDMANALHESREDIESAFLYWQELGVLQILSVTDDMEVRYLPSKFGSHAYKKYNKSKYEKFNVEIQEIISGRQITPNEFNEYYYIIESLGMTPCALLMTAKYCVSLKGNKVNFAYISAVVHDFVRDNILDEKDLENRLKEQEIYSSDLKVVLNKLKIKSAPSVEEHTTYLTWIKDYDFDLATILEIAKHVNRGGFNRLSALVDKCYSARVTNPDDVNTYFENQDKYYDIAKNICKKMGLYYENLDNVIDKYVTFWLSLGYDKDTLVELADYCFIKSIRTLDGLNGLVLKFSNLGLITLDSIHTYIDELNSVDAKIKEILEKLGLSRHVNNDDRTKYNLWISWEIPYDILDYAISISSGKESAMIYLHKVLSTIHSSGIKTLDEAKNFKFDKPTTSKTKSSTINMRNYKKEDLTALFNDVKEVEL